MGGKNWEKEHQSKLEDQRLNRLSLESTLKKQQQSKQANKKEKEDSFGETSDKVIDDILEQTRK